MGILYLSGVVRPDVPSMVTPQMGQRPTAGLPWGADNGRFSNPAAYSDAGYLRWLGTLDSAFCLFATAPDVVGDAEATLSLSAPLFAPIRALGYPVAFVAQDGLERLPVPWDDFDALFVGGTTAWKLSEAAAGLVAEAKRRGKWTHMGRVNSLRRLRFAESIGCDSADGTFIKFGGDHNEVRMKRWLAAIARQPMVWS